MISFEEFNKQVYTKFRENNKNYPIEEIEKYLKENAERIRESYEIKKDSYQGADEYITSGLVYALSFEF